MENQELIKQVTEKAEKWLTPAYDAETQAEVKRMLENPDKTELIDSFYKDLEFGTGGLRGIMGAGTNRMNIYTNDEWEADRMRAQMDYHMFLAHALAVNACHELVEGGKIAPAVSSTCTYPLTNKPEDVWAARMNDWFKTNYCLEMHTNGEYPGYYMRYLEERNIVPKMEPCDVAILKSAKIDYIALNYYRTLCASYLPADAEHPA